jgi:hypothetical protein
MKSFLTGLITIIVLGLIGYATFKSTSKLMTGMFKSPSPVAFQDASPSPTTLAQASIRPSSTPEPSVKPTTKGGEPIKDSGVVKGATTKRTITTTTTTSHLTLNIVKSSICPISYMTEIKDIKGPLTFRYKLIDNTSFGITIWGKDGNELLQNTTYSGNSGSIKTISGVDYMKVRVESKSCAGNNDNWITLTAER